jgi:hypothetical protein
MYVYKVLKPHVCVCVCVCVRVCARVRACVYHRDTIVTPTLSLAPPRLAPHINNPGAAAASSLSINY